MNTTPMAQEESSPAIAKMPLVAYDSDDDGAKDPMVTELIQPFTILVMIRELHTQTGAQYELLIDSGCPRCLINHQVVDELGIGVRRPSPLVLSR